MDEPDLPTEQTANREELLNDLKFLQQTVSHYLWTAIMAEGIEREKIYGDLTELHRSNLQRCTEIIEKIKQAL